MPEFHKLSKSEIEQLSRRQTNLIDLGEYLDHLKTLQIGDWGSIELAPGETQRVVKRRASTAASSLGKKLRWRSNRDGQKSLIFQLQNQK